jgi:hypothetical protein
MKMAIHKALKNSYFKDLDGVVIFLNNKSLAESNPLYKEIAQIIQTIAEETD